MRTALLMLVGFAIGCLLGRIIFGPLPDRFPPCTAEKMREHAIVHGQVYVCVRDNRNGRDVYFWIRD